MKKIIVLVIVALFTISTGLIVAAKEDEMHLLTTTSKNDSKTAIKSQTDKLDPFESLKQNVYFKNYEFQELNENIKTSESEAVDVGKKIVGEKSTQEAKFISAVKVSLTNNESPQLLGSKIILKDYPVWIVTFHGITLEKTGPAAIDGSKVAISSVYADENVIIDANSGEEIETVSHSSNLK